MNAINPSEEVTVVVRRHILPGHEGQFEHAMRDFVNFVLSCPGHVGISVLRPSDGNGEYVVVDRFASAAARKATARETLRDILHSVSKRARNVTNVVPVCNQSDQESS